MPSDDLFAKGFDVYKGRRIGNLLITNFTVTEQTIVKNSEYRYNVSITLQSPNLIKDLKDYFLFNFTPRIINSSYGNPYQCTLQEDDYQINGNTAIVYFIGHSKKV